MWKSVCMREMERVENNSKRESNKKPAASTKCIKCMSNPNKCWLTIEINSCEKNTQHFIHKEAANRNGKRSRKTGGVKRREAESFLPDEFSANNCPRLKWISLNQTTDGYYFYVLLVWYNAVIFMPVHHFDFVLSSFLLAGWLADLLLCSLVVIIFCSLSF